MYVTVIPVSAYMALAFVFGFIQINWNWNYMSNSLTYFVQEMLYYTESVYC